MFAWLPTMLLDVLPSLLAGAIMATLAVLLTRRKARLELRTMRLEVQVEATERAGVVALTLEAYKAEQSKALQVVASELAQTIQEERRALAVLASQLTHVVSGIDGVERGVGRLEASHATQVELFAARAQSAAAIVLLQETKDQMAKLFAEDLTKARTEIEELHTQIAALLAAKE